MNFVQNNSVVLCNTYKLSRYKRAELHTGRNYDHTHRCLDHGLSTFSHIAQELVHIERIHAFKPVQHRVQDDKGPAAAHTSTAVHNQGWVVLCFQFANMTEKGNKIRGILRNSMVRPASELAVLHILVTSSGTSLCIRSKCLILINLAMKSTTNSNKSETLT